LEDQSRILAWTPPPYEPPRGSGLRLGSRLGPHASRSVTTIRSLSTGAPRYVISFSLFPSRAAPFFLFPLPPHGPPKASEFFTPPTPPPRQPPPLHLLLSMPTFYDLFSYLHPYIAFPYLVESHPSHPSLPLPQLPTPPTVIFLL